MKMSVGLIRKRKNRNIGESKKENIRKQNKN